MIQRCERFTGVEPCKIVRSDSRSTQFLSFWVDKTGPAQVDHIKRQRLTTADCSPKFTLTCWKSQFLPRPGRQVVDGHWAECQGQCLLTGITLWGEDMIFAPIRHQNLYYNKERYFPTLCCLSQQFIESFVFSSSLNDPENVSQFHFAIFPSFSNISNYRQSPPLILDHYRWALN